MLKTVWDSFALSIAMSLLSNAVVRETEETFDLKQELILQIFTVILKRKMKNETVFQDLT